jgi:hypothetical protein
MSPKTKSASPDYRIFTRLILFRRVNIPDAAATLVQHGD